MRAVLSPCSAHWSAGTYLLPLARAFSSGPSWDDEGSGDSSSAARFEEVSFHVEHGQDTQNDQAHSGELEIQAGVAGELNAGDVGVSVLSGPLVLHGNIGFLEVGLEEAIATEVKRVIHVQLVVEGLLLPLFHVLHCNLTLVGTRAIRPRVLDVARAVERDLEIQQAYILGIADVDQVIPHGNTSGRLSHSRLECDLLVLHADLAPDGRKILARLLADSPGVSRLESGTLRGFLKVANYLE